MPGDSKQLIKGALILTIAAFVIKILSAIYRVPFQNIVGDTGFYIYQQVYPLYGIAAVLATSGFPVVISRLVAERVATQGKRNAAMQRSLQSIFISLFLIGISLFLIVFFGSNAIAAWMGDPLLAPVIKIIAFPFLLLPFHSGWRGYFQGNGNMVPTAISQVTEQLIRVAVILIVSYILIHNGFSLYDTAQGAWAGAVIGSVGGMAVLSFFVRKNGWSLWHFQRLSVQEIFSTGKVVLVQGVAICFSGLLLILFQLADSLNLYSLLIHSGWNSEEAKIMKGIFDRGQPLIQLGTVAATSLSLTLVPAITTAWMQGNKDMLQKKVETAIKVSLAIGLGAAVGLINIIGPTNTMLFKNSDGSAVLAVLAIAIFFASVIITVSGVLQGLGQMMAPAKYILLGTGCKYIGNILLVPAFGTMGAAWSTVFGLLVISLLLLWKLKQFFSVQAVISNSLVRIAASAIAMTIALQVWLYLFEYFSLSERLLSTLAALTGVVLGGAVYVLMLTRSQLFSEEEISHVPYYSKLYQLSGAGRKERRKNE